MGDTITLEAVPRSVGRARRFCTSTLTDLGAPPDIVSTCVLLVSELATNVVLHARTPFTVSIELDPQLRVEVRDGDPRMPHPRDYSLDAASGRGLRLVRTLSRSSGAERSAEGKMVWFELDWRGTVPWPQEVDW